MSEHTPGPWQQGVEGNNRVYGPDCAGDDSGLIAVVFKGRANARLIAAAPELLHALIGLLETYGKPDERICCSGFECGCQGATVWQEAEHYARAAIAKAENG